MSSIKGQGPSTYVDRVTAWLREHRDDLAASLTDVVLQRETELAIRLATRLLLLTSPDVDTTLLNRVTTTSTQIAEGERRFTEAAVLYELAARCHIADHRLVDAELLHIDERNALLELTDPDHRRTALVALSWRRVRLYWTRNDLEHALRQLDVMEGLLELAPEPAPQAQLLRQIAYGEVLYRKGEPYRAAHLLTRALAAHTATTQTAVERVDAGITIGHALHHSEGTKAAREHWVKVHRNLTIELTTEATSGNGKAVHHRLRQRELHLRTLIARPDDAPAARREDFTVLGPTGTQYTPATRPTAP